jgi:hypothetical protein
MRAPPPVRVQVGLDRRWLMALALLAAAAAGNTMAWALSRLEASGPATAAAAVVAAVFAAAAASAGARWTAPRGHLSWDGHGWVWQPVDAAAAGGEVTLALDLDSWMLLRFDAAAGPRRWLPIPMSSARAVWSPLRGALYGPRPVHAPVAPPPTGSPR